MWPEHDRVQGDPIRRFSVEASTWTRLKLPRFWGYKISCKKMCSAARGIEVPEATSRTVFSLSVPVKNLWSLDGPNALFGASALPFLMLQSDTFPRSHLSTPAWCARGPPGLWFHEHL